MDSKYWVSYQLLRGQGQSGNKTPRAHGPHSSKAQIAIAVQLGMRYLQPMFGCHVTLI